MVKILVFDTETTDLPPKLHDVWKQRELLEQNLLTSVESWFLNNTLKLYPSIIQLSYILYDTEDPINAKIINNYIDLPNEVVISDSSFKVHHISKEIISNKENKLTIDKALNEFMNDAKMADEIVAHNVAFDRRMILAELLRIFDKNHENIKLMMNNSKFKCTMNDTIKICNLKMTINYFNLMEQKYDSFDKLKPPKLIESYKHYFHNFQDNGVLHDAIIDVVICLRVYCKYKYKLDIYNMNKKIDEYIHSFTTLHV